MSAFIRNPTLSVGNDYLLAPIAAAVLGGTAITGGVGSMVAVAGAALFLTQLGQMLKVLGLSTAIQLVVQGVAIAAAWRWPKEGGRGSAEASSCLAAWWWSSRATRGRSGPGHGQAGRRRTGRQHS